MKFIRELFGARTLIANLARNDFKTKYAGSVFGIFWAFVQPMITVLLYWFVFEKGFRPQTNLLPVPFVLWLIAGLVPWFFFSDSLTGGTTALTGYVYLVKKVVFRIEILPVVKVISAGYVHLFFVGFAVLLFILYGFFPGLFLLEVVYYSVCTFVLALGISYATAAVACFFRDLTQIVNILLQIGTWLTPIMWDFNTMDLPGWLKLIFRLNPMFYIVQGYRDALVYHVWFWQRGTMTVYFWCFAIGMWVVGTGMFRRLRVHFADVL